MRISNQQGITLVEMIVASAISLIIMMFITNILITSSRTAAQSEGLGQAQENGRFILSWLQGNIRSAGMSYPTNTSQARIQPFANRCTGAAVPPADNADCSLDQTTSANSDRIAVRRTFVNDAALRTETSNLDCAGAAITTVAEGDFITDVYWVERTNDGYGGVLKCVTYDSASKHLNSAQEIANGIESMHALYGVRPSVDFQYRSNINRYVGLADLNDETFRNDVVAIRIAILTRGVAQQAGDERKRSYILLDAAPVTYEDRIFRHIQSTTIFLPNE